MPKILKKTLKERRHTLLMKYDKAFKKKDEAEEYMKKKIEQCASNQSASNLAKQRLRKIAREVDNLYIDETARLGEKITIINTYIGYPDDNLENFGESDDDNEELNVPVNTWKKIKGTLQELPT